MTSCSAVLLQGIGHTLSGYGSYLLKPEEAEEGSSPPTDGQHVGSDKPANGQLGNGQACREDGQPAEAGKNSTAVPHGQASTGPNAQTPPPLQLRSRQQMQARAAMMY